MRLNRPVACVLSLIVTVLTLVAPASTQVKLPADLTFERGKDSPGLVTFSHEQHKAKVDKCQACHVKIFKMKKGTSGPLTMDKMKAGEQCGACHNGKTELGGSTTFAVADNASCVKCHKK